MSAVLTLFESATIDLVILVGACTNLTVSLRDEFGIHFRDIRFSEPRQVKTSRNLKPWKLTQNDTFSNNNVKTKIDVKYFLNT